MHTHFHNHSEFTHTVAKASSSSFKRQDHRVYHLQFSKTVKSASYDERSSFPVCWEVQSTLYYFMEIL